MSFTPPDFSTILANMQRDIANLSASARWQDDSDWLIRASATSSAIEGLYQHQAWIARQIFPDSADEDMLELHAAVRGLRLKNATIASGIISASGQPGAEIPAGLLLKTTGDIGFKTTRVTTLDGNGQASVSVAAVTAGSTGNLSVDISLVWQSPPLGVSGTAISCGIKGGVDAETHASLLDRLLDLIRRPPAGGNKYDYRRWALEVDGVTAAYVFPLRRGLGTVDVLITSGSGLPSSEILAATQAHIDDVRPVRANGCLVFAPTERKIDQQIRITPASGYVIETAQPLISQAITAYFSSLAPGEPYIRSQLEGRISDLVCITDRQITSPLNNIAAVSDASKVEWLRAGVIELLPL